VTEVAAIQLNREQCHEIALWFEANETSLPEPVCIFLRAHRKYLLAGVDLPRRFEETYRQLRRALGIERTSERRRSGDPLATVSHRAVQSICDERERLEAQRERSDRLSRWHGDLDDRHRRNAKRYKEKLDKMNSEQTKQIQEGPSALERQILEELPPVEQIELTAEEKARNAQRAKQFVERLERGQGEQDEALRSVDEALMPQGAIVSTQHVEGLAAELSEELCDAKVIKTLKDKRVRYDIRVSVSRIELDVDKKVLVKESGERTVVCASTDDYGPARYSVTWSALSTLAILVGQFAMPLNRLATLFSCVGKQFTAGGLSRLLHYVAVRLVAIYIELGEQLSDSAIICGDDTSCRVLEVNSYFDRLKSGKADESAAPWSGYRNQAASEASIERCEQQKRERRKRRAQGEREAKRTAEEEPSLGMLIGKHYDFESQRQDGQGAKQSLNTTVITGRSIAKDPTSLIVFYRSQLGSFGNLLESILHSRKASNKEVTVQADLSTTNLVRDRELLNRFNFTFIGCSAHARRPFAQYEHEDPIYCSHILHLFTGLAMHEERLDAHGRNRHNVLAVRQTDSRRLWEEIREIAQELEKRWSKASKLGTAARYILNHYDKLTAYLDDPRLEPTNNMRERMLRTEKLIENSSMFRKSLEGRFVLDIIRTVLQTAVAAGVPVHEYLVSVLREDPDEIANNPERYTPLGWATRRVSQ
jgi:hypothetical protein